MGLQAGDFSAVLLITAGTLATPTAWAELDLVTDTIAVPWGKTMLESSARRGKNGKIFVPGPGQFANSVDLSVENDDDDATLQVFIAAIASGAIVKVIFCNQKTTPDSLTSGPHADYSYIKGEYLVSGGNRDSSPGKVNTIKLELRRGESCALATMVVPT